MLSPSRLWSKIGCQRQHTEKTDGSLFTIAHVDKVDAVAARRGGLCSQPVAASAPSLGVSAVILYNLGMWLGQRRREVRLPRHNPHNVGVVFVNTPDT